jgi:hypothetical protein
MTQSGVFEADEDLARLRRVEFDLLDAPWFADLP